MQISIDILVLNTLKKMFLFYFFKNNLMRKSLKMLTRKLINITFTLLIHLACSKIDFLGKLNWYVLLLRNWYHSWGWGHHSVIGKFLLIFEYWFFFPQFYLYLDYLGVWRILLSIIITNINNLICTKKYGYPVCFIIFVYWLTSFPRYFCLKYCLSFYKS